MIPEIATERLILRPWRETDATQFHTLLADPDVRRYLCDGRILPLDEVEGFIQRSLASAAADSIGGWGIYLRGQETRMIGFVSLARIVETPDVELKYGLLPAFWGKGLAVEASRTILDYAWRATSFCRILARTDPPNVRSVEVMRRLGMREHSSGEWIAYVIDRP